MSNGPEITSVKIVGCGNPLRRDDGAGIAAVRLLRQEVSRGNRRARWPNLRLEIIEVDCPGLALLDLLEGSGAALIVDAVATGDRPGTLHRFEGWEFVRTLISARYGSSRHVAFLTSHDLGLASVLSLGYALYPERLPGAVVIWGVEPEAVRFGEGLSLQVARAVPTLVASICEDLDWWQREAVGTT